MHGVRVGELICIKCIRVIKRWWGKRMCLCCFHPVCVCLYMYAFTCIYEFLYEFICIVRSVCILSEGTFCSPCTPKYFHMIFFSLADSSYGSATLKIYWHSRNHLYVRRLDEKMTNISSFIVRRKKR